MKHFNIPLFVPHKGCPNDCVFCNQKRITSNIKSVTGEDVEKIISEHLKTLPQDAYIEAAFFGGSFTGIPMEEQKELLSVAKAYYDKGLISGIRLSTRPDYISYEILDLLKSKSVTTIELGVQSLDSEVLKKSNRGHDESVVIKASEMIKEYGFSLGLQMMTGLPGDTFEKSVETAEKFIKIKPDFVRIYPTLVIKDTELENMYNSGAYIPQSIDDAVRLCKHLKVNFLENDIQVIRVSLQPTDEISPDASVVAGPFHPAFGELVDNEIFYDLISDITKDLTDCKVTVAVDVKDVSKAIGNKKINIKRLKSERNIDLFVKGIKNIDSRIKLIGVE